MAQINFYHTNSENLERSSCQLLEKCYINNAKILVKTSGISQMESLNRSLWTFSQKSFIPHGDLNDKVEKDQLIYITYLTENPIEAKNLMLVNIVDSIYEPFDKIFVVFTQDIIDKITDCIKKLSTHNNTVNYYKQNPKGIWQSVEKPI